MLNSFVLADVRFQRIYDTNCGFVYNFVRINSYWIISSLGEDINSMLVFDPIVCCTLLLLPIVLNSMSRLVVLTCSKFVGKLTWFR